MDLFEKCRQMSAGMDADRREALSMFYREVDPVDGRYAVREGRRLLMLGSNDYLGLTHDPRVKRAAREAIRLYGSSSCGARINNGTTSLHRRLEEELARLKGVEKAIVFSNGFVGMMATITSLTGEGDVMFCDQECHASLVDGCRASRGRLRVFRHNDINHLERLLSEYDAETGKLIIVDGVFSQTGRLARLPELVGLARKHGARLLVDDAHGTGVLGQNGHGTVEHFGLEGQIDLIGGTFSKALGAVGGFLASSRDVIDYFQLTCRPHLFTAAAPASIVASVLQAIEIIDSEPERREKMWRNTRRLQDGLRQIGCRVPESFTPITPLILGDSAQTLRMAFRLDQEGIFVNPILPPAVPPDTARLRFTPTAAHTDADIDFTIDAVARVRATAGMAAHATV